MKCYRLIIGACFFVFATALGFIVQKEMKVKNIGKNENEVKITSPEINSPEMIKMTNNRQTEKITLGGGCFWCTEAIFEELNGVLSVVSGYSGGISKNPSYSEISTGNTGHAEVVQIEFEPQVISLIDILEVFFKLHDPSTLNRQGADVGTQYRSVIFYHNENQKTIAHKTVKTLTEHKVFEDPIVTEVAAFTAFYKAENYHQQYFELNKEKPYCKIVIRPKMEKLHKIFADKLKTK